MSDSRFSGQHKAQFLELLPMGELYALNRNTDHIDFGPWWVEARSEDSDTATRLKARFRAAARKAAIAAGAPSRVSLLDWWVCKLTRGQRRLSLEGKVRELSLGQ